MAKLLVVDDDDKQRRRIVRAARDAGFDVHEIIEAVSLEDAREKGEGERVDFAVVDIVLTAPPEKVGLCLIGELRLRHPRCKIIGLTSKGGTEFGIEAMNAGADDFVSMKWDLVNWYELLKQRLIMWRAVVEGLAGQADPLKI
jgi:DNA-binding response OmpR family regulator